MNKHDSERVAGLLQSGGLQESPDPNDADVIVFMTCCVRENADGRLIGQVASLKPYKTDRPAGLIAIGGCIGQRDGEILLRELPHVDVVFGTHNIGRLPALLQAAVESTTPVVEVLEAGEDFSSDLPTHRERRFHAWVPITVGCDNFCTYCIVPHVRGRERSRPASQIITEIESLVADGVLEVTLLGQNVNSYGRDLHGTPSFAPLLRDVARTGIKRIRFATSHPKDLSDETISVMADEPAVCRSLHLPVQSGSDRILEAMNRRYTAESYLATIEKLYAAMPDLALSTDIIVGFPGETVADFEATLDVVRAARYDQAFTFIYSPREGTPAATMPDQVPREISQLRFDRLVEIVHASAQSKNTALLGTVQRALIVGPGSIGFVLGIV
ncbi:MAG: tRNA (N6-isopentenyl adenosine(37)-C2)-methylthiotransferase MiaB, partial [Coriobacteriia bacterium]|nr:tRNA (N6-isopentenyl adenosine(37)-C2)-methylthiotransferase MiaB [Coriobacteriia bacterium]